MKKQIYFFMVCFAFVLELVGCGVSQNSLQRLAQIDIYSSEGNLVNTVTDEDTLHRFNELLSSLDNTPNTDSQQDEFRKMTSNLDVLYTVIAYKTPAAVFNDGSLEKYTEITIYIDSNIVKEQIAAGMIKSFNIAEEDLAYYTEASDQDMEFVLSLVKKETAP